MPTAVDSPAADVAAQGLHVRDLRVAFDGRTVVDGIDLDVAAGEIVGVLGPNGCGKSTTLRGVVGLAPLAGGHVWVDGRRVRGSDSEHLPPEERHRVAMIFQQVHLVKRASVLDNVCAGALGRLPLRQSAVPALFPRALRAEAMACLERVGLADRALDRAGRLSGGQQQRVAVARALCQRAGVLLADEPTSALDPAASEQVMALLAELAHDDGLAVAAVLHDPDLARAHSDRLIGMVAGHVRFDAPTAGVTAEAIGALYAAAPRDLAAPPHLGDTPQTGGTR